MHPSFVNCFVSLELCHVNHISDYEGKWRIIKCVTVNGNDVCVEGLESPGGQRRNHSPHDMHHEDVFFL